MAGNEWDPEPTIRRAMPFAPAPAPAPARRPHVLVLYWKGEERKEFALELDEVVIGRSEGSNIRIQSPTVSRRHAVIARRGPEHRIRDLDSHNGVMVNEVKIHSAVLCDGDRIQVGDAIFEYHRGTSWPSS